MRTLLLISLVGSGLGARLEPSQDTEDSEAELAPIQLNPIEPEGFREVPDPYRDPEPEVQREPAPEPASKPAPAEPATPMKTPSERELQPESQGAARGGPRLPNYPATWFSAGAGGGPNVVSIGLGVTQFVVPWVGVGLELRDDIIFNSPGTFNSFVATPTVTFLALPRRHFSPFARAGFGVNFYSAGLGVYGQWRAGGGFLIRFARRYSVDIGLEVGGNVPRDKWFRNFECDGGGEKCWLSYWPSVGFGVAFGGDV